ncbi:putative KRAB-A domain-containing protein 2-like [Capsicum annuum]|nr:putative KRAB-A domain-containing protein 2-like [Capsicum annuum]
MAVKAEEDLFRANTMKYILGTYLLMTYGLCVDEQLMEDLQEKKKQKSEIQKELDLLKDNLTFEKQNLEVADYDCDKFTSLCNEKDAELQVLEKFQEELKARAMLRTAEETKKRLLSEKASLEEKIEELEKKISSGKN